MRLAGARHALRHDLDLSTELCVEFLTRYQVKPDTMYTFTCSQVFRRDEYAWHYQNVHRDIHCGLNGWLEHRCPLAQYGCTYSRRMFHPISPGSQLVFSEVLESFGVSFPSLVTEARPIENGDTSERSKSLHVSPTTGSEVLKDVTRSLVEEVKPNGKGDAHEGAKSRLANGHSHTGCTCEETGGALKPRGKTLLDLPFEVLQFIAGFLDAFSLNNFSMVSKHLRDVSCSLLTTRGMVVLKWERLGKRCWSVCSEDFSSYMPCQFLKGRQLLLSVRHRLTAPQTLRFQSVPRDGDGLIECDMGSCWHSVLGLRVPGICENLCVALRILQSTYL
ncbi:hypothetical protein HPB51_003131 [Rhipicephalus microplus]|uniref:F-box domain-containing protein n=1 Tax=Rhipicephalus microplus TaxID=6941 RepID=A0A9J6EL58_RHIMP|nr:hypothetical protein HPB51_003131 [Rhipicephalus microplus]